MDSSVKHWSARLAWVIIKMNLYDTIFIPLAFGLIGFIEPCSLGINLIFLNRINDFEKSRRIKETLTFTFVRGAFLGLMGLSAGFIGSKIITIQSSFFLILGGVYILLGGLALLNMYKPIFSYEINISKYFRDKESIALGFIFGLVIPACGIAFVLALLGKSIVLGNLLDGFLSLFIFGIGLSSPLVLIGAFNRSHEITKNLSERARRAPWLAGLTLMIVGLLTMLSSTWWAGVAK